MLDTSVFPKIFLDIIFKADIQIPPSDSFRIFMLSYVFHESFFLAGITTFLYSETMTKLMTLVTAEKWVKNAPINVIGSRTCIPLPKLKRETRKKSPFYAPIPGLI